ncbi:pyrroline-5-carboxylate reductase [Bacillus tianshenii]|nr:pyrroline-5-carboxylate reductase [Bacillus tianshenii]
MDKRIGFIGCGNMAQAIIKGMVEAKVAAPEDIMASAMSEETLHHVQESLNIQVTKRNSEVAEYSDILFLAVKPNQYASIIAEIEALIKETTIIVTIAAGIDLKFMEQTFGRKIKAIRTMPNTPSLVGEGMSAICANEYVTDDDLKAVLKLFESFGKAEVIDESLMDAIPAISGSSPAYVYMFIESLADGGVKQGIPREQAYKLAAQAVLGAAKMVLETDLHPGALKDQVCSPGGATIEAVTALEKNNFRGSILSAMESCTKKAKGLSEE